ncbi:Glu-tRNA(Gln) amidotransferase subunit GatE [Candidatus Micrarchaeota archaeon]|nr:Glu-tRNA(Gln) amidotransferase subunit GatE [Candidatus Micrarchaeota archaeon]MBD3417817.1 Glu-tRNA(Gln) amidotransferase subunit GatE [Candidatus Micrarchaeota archaeon]
MEKQELKCGIEIHQRLDTGKLFCRCPSTLTEEENPDLRIIRNLRASESEMGELDRAARLEQEKQLDFEYDVFRKNCCLVETDEEPPLPMDQEALLVALGVAQQLRMRAADQVHVMRKIVVDGSNTSGFQRTALLATNGFIETSRGKVGIDTIAIEEESAGIIETKKDGMKHYRLDRLGIPLIELATSPDIVSGEHCKEVAEKIGMVLRATGKAARGLGTIRQDVNISIPEGARVEIKGVQDLKLIPRIVEIEVGRQQKLLSILQTLKPIKPEENPRIIDLSNIFSNTDSAFINRGLVSGKRVMGFKLDSHKGVLGTELQPGKRYGTELADYAKTAGVKGIIHSDEEPSKYGISEEEQARVRELLSTAEKDAFVLVLAEEGQARMALARVAERAAIREVPGQTRRVNPDGTTSYMRPLPGKARMYPETDTHPINITDTMLEEALQQAGEGLEAKERKLKELLNPEMAKRMLKSKHLKLFEKFVEMGVEPMLAATTLEDTLVALRREGTELKNPEPALTTLFEHYLNGEFVKSAIVEILPGMAEDKQVQEILEEKNLRRITGEELKELVGKHNRDMGEIMKNYRLRVDAKEVKEILKQA